MLVKKLIYCGLLYTIKLRHTLQSFAVNPLFHMDSSIANWADNMTQRYFDWVEVR